jgi:CheY-like chemotaxis protein
MFGMLRAFGALLFNSTSVLAPSRNGNNHEALSERPKCTVLVIDDDSTWLDTLRPLLQEQGFDVLTCTSGAKALNMLRYGGSDIRVVLLDYNMPQLDGAETLQYMRQLNPQVKVVALTGVDIHLLPEGFHKGVDNLIMKPCRSTELVASINSLLGVAAAAPGLS